MIHFVPCISLYPPIIAPTTRSPVKRQQQISSCNPKQFATYPFPAGSLALSISHHCPHRNRPLAEGRPPTSPTPHPLRNGPHLLTRALKPCSVRAKATALLASLAPLIRAQLAQRTQRMLPGILGIMQSDPAHSHVLFAEPDLLSPDGRRLHVVCSLCCVPFRQIPSFSPSGLFFPGQGVRNKHSTD